MLDFLRRILILLRVVAGRLPGIEGLAPVDPPEGHVPPIAYLAAPDASDPGEYDGPAK